MNYAVRTEEGKGETGESVRHTRRDGLEHGIEHHGTTCPRQVMHGHKVLFEQEVRTALTQMHPSTMIFFSHWKNRLGKTPALNSVIRLIIGMFYT